MAHAELSYGDKKIALPVIKGTEGELGIDISKLRSQTGMITLDNGYMNTGSCESSITYIDGDVGILRYRGYPIEEVSEKTDFLETCYLIIYGQLPTQEQYDNFCTSIKAHHQINADIFKLIKDFPPQAHPMSSLISAASCLSAYYPYDSASTEQTDDAIHSFLGRLPVIAAAIYRSRLGLEPIAPDLNQTYAGNFLHMMFGGEVDTETARALDVLLLLHVDHEQNCSTSAMRMVSSSMVNLYAAGAAAMAALWGPLHGGANQAVIEMLEAIDADGGDVEKYVAMAKDKDNSFRLMGFGHRVYKNFDPRGHIIKLHADVVLNKLHVQDPLLDLAKSLEQTALSDDYFVSRKLFPNVDFYSGIIYKAMGIPTDMFTVMFALGRLPGWIAQWRELMADPNLKIGRPRQIYQGPGKRTLESLVQSRH